MYPPNQYNSFISQVNGCAGTYSLPYVCFTQTDTGTKSHSLLWKYQKSDFHTQFFSLKKNIQVFKSRYVLKICTILDLKILNPLQKYNKKLLVILNIHKCVCDYRCFHGGYCNGRYSLKFVLGVTTSRNATSHFHKRMKGQRAYSYFYCKPSPLEQRNMD